MPYESCSRPGRSAATQLGQSKTLAGKRKAVEKKAKRAKQRRRETPAGQQETDQPGAAADSKRSALWGWLRVSPK